MEYPRVIQRAEPADHELLTTISFRSKSHWAYPEHYLQIWKNELTITPEYIERNEVFVCKLQGTAVAYYSLVELAEELTLAKVTLAAGLWLDHMFVLPEYIGQGLGRSLFLHCRNRLSARGASCLHILADPNAEGFYLKMGCQHCSLYPSSIPGRDTPYLTCQPATHGCQAGASRNFL